MDSRSLSHVVRDWLISPLQTQMMALSIQLEGMNTTMALNADELKARIDNATNNLAGDVRSLKDKLAAALTDKEVYADAKVQDALSGFDSLADRLDALASDTPEDALNEATGEAPAGGGDPTVKAPDQLTPDAAPLEAEEGESTPVGGEFTEPSDNPAVDSEDDAAASTESGEVSGDSAR